MKDLIKPAIVSVVGTIVKIDELFQSDFADQIANDVKVITIEESDRTQKVLWFNVAMISEFGLESILFVDNIVNVQAEERVIGKTEFVDADEVIQKHGHNRNIPEGTIMIVPTNASNASMSAMFVDLKLPEFLIKMIADLRKDRLADVGGRTERFHSSKRTDVSIEDQITTLEQKLLTARPLVRVQIQAQLDALYSKLPTKGKPEKVAK